MVGGDPLKFRARHLNACHIDAGIHKDVINARQGIASEFQTDQGCGKRPGEDQGVSKNLGYFAEAGVLLNLPAAEMSGTLVLDSLVIIALEIGMLAFQALKHLCYGCLYGSAMLRGIGKGVLLTMIGINLSVKD